MAAAMLIAAASACSSGDSTKVFNAGGESTAQRSASSPGSSGVLPGNANAAGLGATQTATAAAVAADEGAAGQEGDKAAEKIGDVPAAPSPRPSPSPSVISSPSPRATPAPTTEAEPPMRLARPVRTADRPVVVDVIQPEDVPREGRAPARVIPGGADAAAREPSAPSRTPFPRSSGASTGGWGAPALVEDFGGEALRLGGGGQEVNLSAASVQRYGRWEIRVRAEEGALPVALLRSAGSGAPEYGDAQYTEYAGSRYDIPDSPQADGARAEDAEIGVTGIGDAGGRRAEFSVRQGRERARAEMAADFTQWHTIAVDWLPGRVTFWLDGRQVWNYTGPYVPRSEGMGLVLRNGASGGGTVYVDWVRIYRAPGR
ncbi:glycoside hydrolase family 16 protein [Microbispora sp. H10836]|uniref:glycoside hydrolase family 16 protein n=1 Tax=Microbispora sp. H10836 TaxID=2729106 RepID=UPI0014731393|nr:glycoside hydrolase family 16 protein [Microbispora sp. H10836]